TFSRFQPMRNVPARVVCMLGMNDGAFPSAASGLSFDLMDRRKRRKLGDHQTRDEERYAFLETLMAARERLIITYTGQSAKDNKPLPPSVLVSELLDTVDASFSFTDTPQEDSEHQPAATELLTVRHPLHPFSPRYFDAHKTDDRLISFSEKYYQVARALESVPAQINTPSTASLPQRHGGNAQTKNVPAVIELNDLISFFRSPSKYFYTQSIGVYLDLRTEELPDDEEALSPDTLGVFDLKCRLLEHLADAPNAHERAEQLRQRWEAEGYLIPGNRRLFDETLEIVRQLLDAKQKLSLGPPDPPFLFETRLDDNIRLQGCLQTYTSQGNLLVMRPANEQPKDIIAARLHHLSACASGLEVTTHTIFTKKLSDSIAAHPPLEQAAAQKLLSALSRHFIEGSQRPLCFDPEIGWMIANGKQSQITEEDWSGDKRHKKGTDIYTRREFGDSLPEPDSAAWQTLTHIAADLFSQLPGKKGDR
ncbi:MAG: exodeoxyribonuclease V subunit gamma, partial [Kiritimatiellae bacterium]|nr:exodeoxyribonuclease V subunit gamma [Kiritimatiellia bacterium]